MVFNNSKLKENETEIFEYSSFIVRGTHADEPHCILRSRLWNTRGLNATNISFDLLPNRSERIGFHAGIFADLPVLPDFFDSTQVSYP